MAQSALGNNCCSGEASMHFGRLQAYLHVSCCQSQLPQHRMAIDVVGCGLLDAV